jgi:hypothetical protein
MGSMAEIELTESWLLYSLRHVEEKKLYDPEDVYLQVRGRRLKLGKAPIYTTVY